MAILKRIFYITIFLGIVGGYFFWLRPLERKAQESDDYKSMVQEYRITLKTYQEQSLAKINALAFERENAVNENKALSERLEMIEGNHETIDCPVPSVLRNTINSL